MKLLIGPTAWSLLGVILYSASGVKAGISATRIYTDAVSYCAEPKSILISQFDIQYHKANQSVTFSISAASTDDDLDVSANIYANAYGNQLVNLTINLCDYLEGVLCPLPVINFTGYGTYPIPSTYTSKIPSLAWTVPNLEAYARIELTNTANNEIAACLQATLSNGLTTQQSAVRWVTGVFFLVAFLVALVHSTLRWSPSPAVYRWYDILYLFQTAAASGLLNINYPSMYVNFVLNFPWALGLFHNSGIETAVTHLRNATGGQLATTAYDSVDYINRALSPYNEAIALNSFFTSNSTSADFKSFAAMTPPVNHVVARAAYLAKRVTIPSVTETATTSAISNGIPVYVNLVGIPTASAFDTIFIVYMIALAVFLGLHLVWGLVVFLGDRVRSSDRRGSGWLGQQKIGFWSFFAGNMMRLCLAFLFPIFIFGLYQFDIGRSDSWLSLLLAVLCVAWTVIGLTTVFVLSILRVRRGSIDTVGVTSLYTNYSWYNSAGMVYRQYRQRYHFWWYMPLAVATFVRACFIAFARGSAWAQVIGLVVVEFLVLLSCVAFRPHKDRKGDWLGAFLAFCRMCAFGLMIAWIPSMDVDAIIRTILGFVVIVLFGLPVVLLFFGLLYNFAYGYAFRRNKRRVEDGIDVVTPIGPSDVDSETPAMVQTGFGEPYRASPDDSTMMNSGNGFHTYNQQPAIDARESYHPSIDGDETDYQTGYNQNRYSNTQYGYAYGGETPGGSPNFQGYPHSQAQMAYDNVSQGDSHRPYSGYQDEAVQDYHARQRHVAV